MLNHIWKVNTLFVKMEDEYFELKRICAGVPQSSVLGSILYSIYIRDVPNCSDTTITIFADDSAVMVDG